MKRTSRILALIMAVAMVISLCACAGNTDYVKLAGTWNTKLDVTDMMNDELAVSLGVDSIDSGDVKLEFDLTLNFNADKTYHFEYNEDAIAASFETYLDWLCDWMTDYMMDMMVEQTGFDAETINNVFVSEYGMTLAEYVDDLMAESVDLDTLFADSAMETEGYYKLEDNKLYLSNSLTDFDEDTYISYLVDGDALTFVEIVGDHDVFWDDISNTTDLPINFTRG